MNPLLLALPWLTGAASPAQAAPVAADAVRPAVVRIVNQSQRPDHSLPWAAPAARTTSGSGLVIEDGRILTNAHVVANQRMLVVYLDGDPTPHEARVIQAGHDCDLALIEPLEEGLLDGITPLTLGDLPEPRSVVETYGYPAGGKRLSTTRGVVSRIEVHTYVHSKAWRHLSVQTDAAINPGNSGGPVLQDGEVVGVAFQGNRSLDDVGFFIPTDVIEHFLTDLEDGTYDGFPKLGVETSSMASPAARARAGLPDGATGMAVDFVLPGSSADGLLQQGDVLLAIDGVPIAEDGTIVDRGLRLDHALLIDRHQIGDTLTAQVFRDGQRLDLEVALQPAPFSDAYAPAYDTLPRYVIYAGLVFAPLTYDTLSALGGRDPDPEHLYELYHRPHLDPSFDKEESVVLLRRLDHPVNAQMAWSRGVVLEAIDGQPIRSLADVSAALDAHTGDFHVFDYAYHGRFAVIDREAADAAHPEILRQYGIAREARP